MNGATEIASLKPSQLKHLKDYALAWCNTYFGKRAHEYAIDVKHIRPRAYSPDAFTLGYYDEDENLIYINTKQADHIREYLRTLLHEYTHSRQPIKRLYARTDTRFGYARNPLEVAARAMERYWRDVLRDYLKQYPNRRIPM
jgi:hypothetical protein